MWDIDCNKGEVNHRTIKIDGEETPKKVLFLT